MSVKHHIKPAYEKIHFWEAYEADLLVEYTQSMEEGLDLAEYEELFRAVAKLPKNEYKQAMGEVLFELVSHAPMRADYPYREPSTLAEIKALRKEYPITGSLPQGDELKDKIHGAWLGRVCGCLLGKPLESLLTKDIIPLLKNSGNYPLQRYVESKDVPQELIEKYPFPLGTKPFVDLTEGMPVDDDTNYTVMAQLLIERCGRDFTSEDVAQLWLTMQNKDAYCTAERVAYRNFVNGYQPPESAIYKNPYREWIGAQIRGDYFGYINPGDPETAAEMAFRDACISHVKNGIYGEMFAAAMIACAAVTDNIKDIILGGLAQIPQSSRLFEAVSQVIGDYESGMSREDCFRKIHARYDEANTHDWCHTISNAVIVTAVLLYGEGDLIKSICMAVETGFDTDCNGATVGSVLGMRNGVKGIDEAWIRPLHDRIHTSLYNVGTVKISDCVEQTMKHLK